MRLRAAVLIALTFAPLALSAQGTKDPKARRDTSDDDEGSGPAALTYGATAGALGLNDGRTQSGVTGVLRWHFLPGLAVGVTPSFAHSASSDSAGGSSVSGFTDLPVELSYDHTFPGLLPATLGFGLAVSLPVGDTTYGFGSGKVGYSLNAGVSWQPTPALSLHAGTGKPLTDYSLAGALGGSNAMWGDLEASYQLNDRVGATLGFDGDLASGDSLGAARTLAGGLSFALAGPLTLTVNGATGISGPAAKWQFSAGLGTDFAGLSSLGSSSAVQRAVGVLGGRSHSATSHGRNGTTTPGSGHGRKP